MTSEQEIKRDLLKEWYCQRGLPMTDFIRDLRQIAEGHGPATVAGALPLGEAVDKMYEEWESLGHFMKGVEKTSGKEAQNSKP